MVESIEEYGCQPCLSPKNLDRGSKEQWADENGRCNFTCPFYEQCQDKELKLSKEQSKEYAFFKRAEMLEMMNQKNLLLDCYPFTHMILDYCPRKKTAEGISQWLQSINYKRGCSTSFAEDWDNLKKYIIPAIQRNHQNLEKMRYEGLFTHKHTSRIISTMNEILNIAVCWFCHKPEKAFADFSKKVHMAYEKFQPLIVLKKGFDKREKQTFLKIFYDDFEKAYDEIWFDRQIQNYEEFWNTGYSIFKKLIDERKSQYQAVLEPEPNQINLGKPDEEDNGEKI